MRLRNVKFIGYKTVNKGSLDIELDITCLIGMNESGKSNLLTGLEKLDKNQAFTVQDIARHSNDYTKDSTEPPSAQITFQLNSEERARVAEILGIDKSKMPESLVLKKSGETLSVIYPGINVEKSVCKRELIGAAKEKLVDDDLSTATGEEATVGQQDVASDLEAPDSQRTQVTEPDIEINEEEIVAEISRRINSLLPQFRYFDSVNIYDYYLPDDGIASIKKLNDEPKKNKPVCNLLKLAGIEPTQLLKYKTSADKTRRDTILKRGSQALNDKLLRAFWPIDAVELQLSAEENTLKIRVVDDEDFSPGERSRGIQWALAFNIYFLAECDGDLKNTVLLIDEPGVFLHIDAQVKMLNTTFKSITNLGNQIIYSTHLPFLINKRSPQQLRILNKPGNSTEIGNKAWSTGQFGSIPEPARSALGINFDDVFMFGDKNLVVEGPSDQIYLSSFIKKLNPKLENELTIVPAYGKENVGKVVAMSVLANKECYALVDSDFDLELLKQKLGKEFEPLAERVVKIDSVLSEKSITTIEDIVPTEVFDKALRSLYNRTRVKDKLSDSFSVSHPFVENAEKALAKQFKAKGHRLLKTDLSREVSELIPAEKPRSDKMKLAATVIKKINGLFKGSDGA